MRIIGIDPGLSGAIAHLTRANDLHVWDMPVIEQIVGGKKRNRINVHAFRDIIIDIGQVDMVVLEDVNSMPTDGKVQASTFGRGLGQLEGVLIALDRPLTLVRPQVWTKKLGVGADKGVHRATAMRLNPTKADLFKRVKDDGRADAALIALWYMREFGW